MFRQNVVSTCRRSAKARGRTLATVADAAGPSTSAAPPKPLTTKVTSNANPAIKASVILNRSPILTRTPSLFEQTYYSYQSRIQRALFTPFADEFYFKPGALLEDKFTKEERAREKDAFGRIKMGGPKVVAEEPPAGTDPANVPTSAATSKTTSAPTAAAETTKSATEDEDQPMPRIHEADLKSDVRSLDRQGERNLYLLLQVKDHSGKSIWRFPQGDVAEEEALHQAAENRLRAECGSNMDTWIVTRKPVGVYQPTPSSDGASQDHIFFHKAHIMAGQVHPDGKKVVDFAWLTKQEIEPRVDASYWTGVKDMLSDF